ncbi:RNase P/RNase MRP complex subunit [Podila epigama]|nr:RNase P/RNase MRP complex subunit [Podila epigama]
MDNSIPSSPSLEKTSLSLYTELSKTVQESAGDKNSPASTDPQSFIPKYVGDAVVDGYEADKVYSTKVKNKVFMLDNPDTEKNRTESKEKAKVRKRANKSKAITAKEKRSLKVYDIPLESRKYELFLPLNALWKGYMDEIIGSGGTQSAQKLLKADLHGAIITVSRSKCPTYIGATGIVVQETENVFKIITPNDSLRVIPKVNNIFSISIRDWVFTLHGNQFRYRASQRSTKKFKYRPTTDL